MIQIRRMGDVARSMHIQRTRQLHVKAVELGLTHIAGHHALHRQRLIRPFPLELLGQGTCCPDDVLLAYRGIHGGMQLTGILVIEGVEVHHETAVNRTL